MFLQGLPTYFTLRSCCCIEATAAHFTGEPLGAALVASEHFTGIFSSTQTRKKNLLHSKASPDLLGL